MTSPDISHVTLASVTDYISSSFAKANIATADLGGLLIAIKTATPEQFDAARKVIGCQQSPVGTDPSKVTLHIANMVKKCPMFFIKDLVVELNYQHKKFHIEFENPEFFKILDEAIHYSIITEPDHLKDQE